MQIGGRVPSAKCLRHSRACPALKNTRIVPSQYEPQWVAQIDGEVINDDPRLILDRTQFSIVVFDASGRIIGGGYGNSSISMPPGVRSVFVASSGFDAIPTLLADHTMISTEPSYRQPGS